MTEKILMEEMSWREIEDSAAARSRSSWMRGHRAA